MTYRTRANSSRDPKPSDSGDSDWNKDAKRRQRFAFLYDSIPGVNHGKLAVRRGDRSQSIATQIQEAGGEAFAIPVDVNERSESDVMVQTVMSVSPGGTRIDWILYFVVRKNHHLD